MPEPSLKTTVVGSYPVPSWLAASPSSASLRDAVLVVLKTQELAGLDVIADGELSRFNVNLPAAWDAIKGLTGKPLKFTVTSPYILAQTLFDQHYHDVRVLAMDLALFKELRPEIALGIGVIDIKDNEVETPDTVAGRIEHAVKTLGAARVKWVHPDCGFWMLPRLHKMVPLTDGLF